MAEVNIEPDNQQSLKNNKHDQSNVESDNNNDKTQKQLMISLMLNKSFFQNS